MYIHTFLCLYLYLSPCRAINDAIDDVFNDGENFKEVIKRFVLLSLSFKGEYRLF